MLGIASLEELKTLAGRLPSAVLQDFKERRDRNFKINQHLIELAGRNEIDFLIFSQDDTGEYGLNVWEKDQLVALANEKQLQNVMAYSGTDEVIMTMIARWLVGESPEPPRVTVHISPEGGGEIISKFEGTSINASLKAICAASGLKQNADNPTLNADFRIIVHTSGTAQGDHAATPRISSPEAKETGKAVEGTIRLLEESTVKVVLCDVAYANGSDPKLIAELLARKHLLAKLIAYAGWNTTGNTIGSAVAQGIARWHSEVNGISMIDNVSTDQIFKQALFVRFADDWAYQAVVRQQLGGKPSETRLKHLMQPLLEQLREKMGLDPGAITLRLPWKRTFDVDIGLTPYSTASSDLTPDCR
jgi:hypothetical protein